jgi:hypothetical protein
MNYISPERKRNAEVDELGRKADAFMKAKRTPGYLDQMAHKLETNVGRLQAEIPPEHPAAQSFRDDGFTGIPDDEVWPAPIEIVSDLPPAPEFEANVLLPKALADFVLDEADRMPCSPDYIAAALMVCLGSVIGASCALKPKRRDDWIVVPNLWGRHCGRPVIQEKSGTEHPDTLH